MKDSSTSLNEFIGSQIAAARKSQGITQEQLSEKLGFKDRQILSNLEKGNRKIQEEELAVIMRELNKPLDYFIDVYQLPDTQLFSWRAKEEAAAATEPMARNLVAAYKRFSDLTQQNLTPIIPRLAVSPKSSYEEVRALGEYLAEHYWKMGDIPADALVDKIRNTLNVELFFLNVVDEVAGSSVWIDDFCAIFINRMHTEGRRNFSMAHELFHILTWNTFDPSRYAPEEWEKVKDRSEKLANAFASALLMPHSVLLPIWRKHETYPLKGRLQKTAEGLKVSADALFWRLVNLGELNKQDKPDDLYAPHNDEFVKPKPFSQHFVKMLHQVIDCGQVSVRKVCSLLMLNYEDLEEVFIEYDMPVPFSL